MSTNIVKKILPLFCIVLVWFVFAAPYFTKGLVPFPSRYLVTFFAPWSAQPEFGMPVKNNAMPDIITQIYPWRHLSINSLKEGGWGLWNPYSFSGTYHAGNYQSAPFFPLNILFFLFPFIDGWSLLVLLQPLLAGLFMYAFLRSENRSMGASVLGSYSYMFCGFMTTWLAYATLGYAVLFLPLMLLAINKLSEANIRISLTKKQLCRPVMATWWYGLLLAIGTGCSFLSGHFQMSLYVFIITLFYGYYKSRHNKQLFYVVCGYGVLGLLLALPQIGVAIDAFTQSSRTESFITNAGIPFQYLITFLAPDFFGNPVTRNDWFGQYAEWASYIGIIPAVLASVILFSKHSWKHYAIYMLFIMVGLLLATASPVSQLFYNLKIPLLSTSVATRLIFLVSFSLSVLAAYGFDRFVELCHSQSVKHIVKIAVFWGILISIVWVVILGIKPIPTEYIVVAKRNFILPSVLIGVSVLLLLIGIQFKKTTNIILLLLVGITAFEMLRYTTKWIPFEERAFVYPDLPITTYLKQTIGFDRVFGNLGSEFYTYYQIPSIEGYDALYQARYGEFVSAASDGKIKELERSVVQLSKNGQYTDAWLSLMGVKYLIHRKSDGRNVWVFPHWNYPHYQSVYEDDSFEVFENTQSMPRVTLHSSYRVSTSKQESINYLVQKDLDLRDTVILESEPIDHPEEGSGSATLVSTNTNKTIVRVSTNVPKLLLLSDVYDKGWKAYIGNKEVPMYRANYAFRAVLVPQGESEVVFRYMPLSFMVGVYSLFIAMIIILLGSIGKLFYEHRIL